MVDAYKGLQKDKEKLEVYLLFPCIFTVFNFVCRLNMFFCATLHAHFESELFSLPVNFLNKV